MNPLIINSFSPKAEIEIHTKNGEVFTREVVNDAVSVYIVRGIDASAGQAILTLLVNKDKRGRSWQDRVHPMDYIVIRAGNKYKPDGTLPIRFRGFVDSLVESLAMPTVGGPLRRITLVARDYVKLFLINNIQYLWTVMLGADLASFPGLDRNYGISSTVTDVGKIIQQIIDHVFTGKGEGSLHPFLPAFRKATGLNIPDIVLSNKIPNNFMAENLTIQPYTGPLWSLINYLCSPPVGESYVYDGEDTPILVCRPVPFKDEYRDIPSPGQEPELPTIKIEGSIVSGYTLGKTDAQALNFFFVYSDALSNNGSTAPAYASPYIDFGEKFDPYSNSSTGTNPYWNSKSANIYGLKPLNISTPWVELPASNQDKDKGSAQRNAVKLANFLGKIYDHNQDLMGGQITAHGDENLIHGRYIQFGDAEYYLEQVEDKISFVGDQNPSWSTVLSVTRGQGI